MFNPDSIQISVMITFHNQRQFVADCLSSVLNQKTDFNYEILCGDDCSTDGTYEELLVWADKYPDTIRVYRTDNMSVGSRESIVRASNNRYNLLTHAKGRFICFLDGDDYLADSALKSSCLLPSLPASCCPLFPLWLSLKNDPSCVPIPLHQSSVPHLLREDSHSVLPKKCSVT